MPLQARVRDTIPNGAKRLPAPGSYLHDVSRYVVSNAVETVETVGSAESTGVGLPVLATASDVREVVRFLKRKPLGVSVTEMTSAEPRRIFEARKIAAYEYWGIIRRENQRLKLSDLGRDLAEKLEPESRLYLSILRSVPSYSSAVEWMYSEALDVVTHHEIIQFWRSSQVETGFDAIDVRDEEAAVVSFFSLCHAAELGTATVGKRGQPARLRVEIDQVRSFLEGPGNEPFQFRPSAQHQPIVQRSGKCDGKSIQRVYVSTGRQGSRADQLRNVLALADFDSEMPECIVFENGFLPSSYLAAMEKCEAAIFFVGPDDCVARGAEATLSSERVIEINVALALFGRRVILFWNGPDKPPINAPSSGLQLLTGDSLDWETSVRLVGMLKELQNQV